MKTVKVTEEYAGDRLDKALLMLFPQTSLRHRRRLFTSWDICVDGVVRSPAYKTRIGQTLTAVEKAGNTSSRIEEARLEAMSPPWTAFYKPAGLDSETLAGGGRSGLDRLVAALNAEPGESSNTGETWRLVSRLDRDVSGLVAAAQGDEAERAFRRLEAAGMVDKTYCLLTRPHKDDVLQTGEVRIIRNALDMADRKRVRVLEGDDQDPTRWTRFTALGSLCAGDGDVTLVRAHIARGARHQIRAHAAVAGLPILGDGVYGLGDHPSGLLFLHCAELRIEEFTAASPPPWEAALGDEYGRLLELAGLDESPEK